MRPNPQVRGAPALTVLFPRLAAAAVLAACTCAGQDAAGPATPPADDAPWVIELLDDDEDLEDVALDAGAQNLVFIPDVTVPQEPVADELAAMRAFNAEPSLAKQHALAKIRFAHAARMAGEWEKSKDAALLGQAVEYAASATQLDPAKPAYWFLSGCLYASITGDVKADVLAQQALRKALELRPGLIKCRLVLGQVYLRRGSYDRALAELERALEADKPVVTPPVVAAMAWAYVLDGQLQRGRAYLEGLLKRQPPAAASVQLGLALLLLEQDQPGAAKPYLETAAADGKADAGVRQYAGIMLDERRRRAAIREQIQGLAPDKIENWRALCRVVLTVQDAADMDDREPNPEIRDRCDRIASGESLEAVEVVPAGAKPEEAIKAMARFYSQCRQEANEAMSHIAAHYPATALALAQSVAEAEDETMRAAAVDRLIMFYCAHLEAYEWFVRNQPEALDLLARAAGFEPGPQKGTVRYYLFKKTGERLTPSRVADALTDPLRTRLNEWMCRQIESAVLAQATGAQEGGMR